MGKHENEAYPFFSSKETIADLANVKLFRGIQELRPENIQLMPSKAVHNPDIENANAKSFRRERDILALITIPNPKNPKNDAFQFFLGIELSSYEDYLMPYRLDVYDAVESEQEAIEHQILMEHKFAQSVAKEPEGKSKTGKKPFSLSKLTENYESLPGVDIVVNQSLDPWLPPMNVPKKFPDHPEQFPKHVQDLISRMKKETSKSPWLHDLYDPSMIDDAEANAYKDFLELYSKIIKAGHDCDKLETIVKEHRYFPWVVAQALRPIFGRELDRHLKKKKLKDGTEVADMRTILETLKSSYKQEGKEEGIAIGKEEGIAIGKEEGIAIGKEEGIAIGKEKGTVTITIADVTEIMKKLNYTLQDALNLISVKGELRVQMEQYFANHPTHSVESYF